MYTEEHHISLESETPEISTNEEVNVNKHEVQRTLEILERRKDTGEDGKANKLLKYCGTALTEQLTIIKHYKIPEEWKTSELIPSFKKDEKKQPGKYRGIKLLYVTLKLTTKILHELINHRINFPDARQGVHTGRSCIDAVVGLK